MKNCCYFVYGIIYIITKRQEGICRFRAVDKCNDFSNGLEQIILCTGLRKRDKQWEKLYGV